MSEQTIEAAPIPRSAGGPDRGAMRGGASATALVSEHPGVAVATGLFAFSVVLVLITGTRPGYDPYGWLVWGHQTLQWNLDTNGAPSWKPLAYLFTVPFALIGHRAVWLWMFTSVAVSLSGVIFAARIAYRLTDASPQRRWAGLIAGAFAGAGVLGIAGYTHFILSAQSDTMIVSLCLGAIDFHLCKRPRLAFACLVLGSLGRPEVWPFLGLYSLWAWRAHTSMRRLIIGGLAVLPVLWFGIPALTSKSAFTAGNLAFNSPRAVHGNKITGVISRFFALYEWPLQVAALAGILLAAVRRDRVTLAVAGAALVWVVVEIAFALHGWPAVPRYLFEPAAVLAVLAGVAVGRALAEPPRWASAPAWAGAIPVVVLAVSLAPAALSRVRIERKDLTHERARTRQINSLHAVIAKLGGADRILRCGQAEIEIGFQSILAWETGQNIGVTYFNAAKAASPFGPPVVLFAPRGTGWVVRARRTASNPTACRGLSARTAFR